MILIHPLHAPNSLYLKLLVLHIFLISFFIIITIMIIIIIIKHFFHALLKGIYYCKKESFTKYYEILKDK